MTAARPSAFAHALSAAIASSGRSLRDLAEELEARGTPTTAANLSHWTSGRSLPRRAASTRVVAELEKILGLDSSDLLTPLRADLLEAHARRSGTYRDPGAVAIPKNADWDSEKKFGQLDSDANWDGEVHREVLEEEIFVSADYRTVSFRVTLIVRYGSNPAPTLHVSSFWDHEFAPEADDIGVYRIEGAETGETVTHENEEGISKMTTLHLPADRAAGTLHRVYYEHRFNTARPTNLTALRPVSWPISLYTGRVTFEGEVPEAVEWIQARTMTEANAAQKIIARRELAVMNSTVQASAENLSDTTIAFVWGIEPADLFS